MGLAALFCLPLKNKRVSVSGAFGFGIEKIN
jgi:hypothetical protein